MTCLNLKFVRGENRRAAEFLTDYFILQPWQDKRVYTEMLARLLDESPKTTLVLCAFTEPEEGEPEFVAFCVAYFTTDDQVFLAQTWKDSKKAPAGTDGYMMQKVIAWAQALGAQYITGCLAGDHKSRANAVFRKWGFQTYACNISLQITDEYQEKLANRITREINKEKENELLPEQPAVETVAELDTSAESGG